LFVTAQGPAYHRFRRALDRRNVTEALSAATEIQVVGLIEALELTLLLADREPLMYERAALPLHSAPTRTKAATAARCSSTTSATLAHLHARGTSFALVSRAPLAKIEP
jgi:predicted dithiol-disulfide oxidoreductase (DUF899 family)